VNIAVTISALCLGAAGLLLLFAPRETGDALVPAAAGADAVLQLLGAAFLGFAMMNWTARGAALGGIYGRAVVVGNLMHLLGGAFVLLGKVSSVDATPAFLVLTGLYALGAVLFVYLTYFSSGLRPRSRA
jgi:hypothetical protein